MGENSGVTMDASWAEFGGQQRTEKDDRQKVPLLAGPRCGNRRRGNMGYVNARGVRFCLSLPQSDAIIPGDGRGAGGVDGRKERRGTRCSEGAGT